ncbi:MAG TPA: PAS domain-containing protein, partial [Luteimonas sp.]|nr:PAS domain-containing protein [Luteimonas sp.]
MPHHWLVPFAALACCVVLFLADGPVWARWMLTGLASGLALGALAAPASGFRGPAVAALLAAGVFASAWLREATPVAAVVAVSPLLGALAGASLLRSHRGPQGSGTHSGLSMAMALLAPATAWLVTLGLGTGLPSGQRIEGAVGLASGALAALLFAITFDRDAREGEAGAGAASPDAAPSQWLATVASALVLAALPWLPAPAMPFAALPLLAAAPRAAPRAIGACAFGLVGAWVLLGWANVVPDRGAITLAALGAAVAHAVALLVARANGGPGDGVRLVARLRDELQAVLAQGPAPAAVLDSDLRHVSANAAYTRWIGEAPPVQRRTLGDVHGRDAEAVLAAARRALAGQPQRTQLERADGRALDIHLEPRFSVEGPVDGVYLLAQDTSWRAALDMQLAMVLESLPLPTLALDAGARIRQGNGPARVLLGVPAGEDWPPDLSGYLDSDASARLAEGVQHVRERRVALEISDQRPLGTPPAGRDAAGPIALRLAPLASERGIVALLTIEDLAPALARERALAEGRTQAEVAIDAIAETVVACDARGVIVLFNSAASRLTGWPRTAALGRPLDEVLSLSEPGSDAPAPADIGPILAGRPAPAATRKWLLRGDGERVMVSESAAPVHDRFGQVCGVVLLLHDVTESQAQAQSLAHQAQHDPLTGLPNRVLLRDRLSQALAQLDRGYRGALLYVDLDRFKPINDSLGHPVGDRVLQEIATR